MNGKKRQRQVKKRLVALAMLVQKGRCFYCWHPLSGVVTAEHLVSQSAGGRYTQENIKAACPSCNIEAGDLPPNVKIQASAAGRLGGKAGFQRVVAKAKIKRRQVRAAVERGRNDAKAARRAYAAVAAARSKSSGPQT